jgi:hypothetical protein
LSHAEQVIATEAAYSDSLIHVVCFGMLGELRRSVLSCELGGKYEIFFFDNSNV